MHRISLLTGLLVLLALPAAAQAGTASYDGGTLVYQPVSGGTWLYLGKNDDGRITLTTDLADKFTAAPAGCEIEEYDDTIMHCTASAVRLEMGDGDDDVGIQGDLGVPVRVEGGPGNDDMTGDIEGTSETFIGGPGNDAAKSYGGDDHLEGGDGDDLLQGGEGADTVLGGPGADKVSGEGSGSSVDPDVVDGGPGYDAIEYDWTTVGRDGRGPVDVSLDGGGGDGFAGEGDDVRGIEKLSTSTEGTYTGTDAGDELYVGAKDTTVNGLGGDDTIYTSYGNDAIDGGAGNDTIRGYDGDDVIVGGAGADNLIGDTLGQTCNVLTCSTYIGNDIIDARDGERDSIDCGPGADTAFVDSVDVHTHCEDVRVGGGSENGPGGDNGGGGGPAVDPTQDGGVALTATITRSRLRAALARGLAIRLTGATPGRLALTARSGRKKVGGCAMTVAADGTGSCRLRFTAAGKRKLRRARKAKLRITGPGVTSSVTLRR